MNAPLDNPHRPDYYIHSLEWNGVYGATR
jgi:hypothetical protein